MVVKGVVCILDCWTIFFIFFALCGALPILVSSIFYLYTFTCVCL